MPVTEDTLLIRDATLDDAPAIAEIYRPYVESTAISFEFEAPDAAEMAGRMRRILEDGYPYLCAERDGRVVGFASAAQFRLRPAYDTTAETSIYVGDGQHGRGVGRALMTEIESRLRVGGFKLMVAGSSGGDTSVRFHTSLGFEVAGTIPDAGYKFGKSWSLTLMWKRL